MAETISTYHPSLAMGVEPNVFAEARSSRRAPFLFWLVEGDADASQIH